MTERDWAALLAVVAVLEFFRSVIIYVFISPLRNSGKKIEHLESEITALNLGNIRNEVIDHEGRVRELERAAVREDKYQKDRDGADKDRRLMNKKLDILLQRTARLAHPVEERELTDES